jgi:hypothetical protein
MVLVISSTKTCLEDTFEVFEDLPFRVRQDVLCQLPLVWQCKEIIDSLEVRG